MPPGPTYLSGEPISAWFDVCYCHVAAALKFGPLPENLTSARAPEHAWCLKMFSFPELGCFIFFQVGTARLREGFQRLCNVLPSSTKQHPQMTRVYRGLNFNVWPYESGKKSRVGRWFSFFKGVMFGCHVSFQNVTLISRQGMWERVPGTYVFKKKQLQTMAGTLQ